MYELYTTHVWAGCHRSLLFQINFYKMGIGINIIIRRYIFEVDPVCILCIFLMFVEHNGFICFYLVCQLKYIQITRQRVGQEFYKKKLY